MNNNKNIQDFKEILNYLNKVSSYQIFLTNTTGSNYNKSKFVFYLNYDDLPRLKNDSSILLPFKLTISKKLSKKYDYDCKKKELIINEKLFEKLNSCHKNNNDGLEWLDEYSKKWQNYT